MPGLCPLALPIGEGLACWRGCGAGAREVRRAPFLPFHPKARPARCAKKELVGAAGRARRTTLRQGRRGPQWQREKRGHVRCDVRCEASLNIVFTLDDALFSLRPVSGYSFTGLYMDSSLKSPGKWETNEKSVACCSPVWA